MQEPRDLTIQDAALQMKARELTAVGLVESCLERIQTREATVRAWVEVYEEAASTRRETAIWRRGRVDGGAAPRHSLRQRTSSTFAERGRAPARPSSGASRRRGRPGHRPTSACGVIFLERETTLRQQ
jgi:hypothetical protein